MTARMRAREPHGSLGPVSGRLCGRHPAARPVGTGPGGPAGRRAQTRLAARGSGHGGQHPGLGRQLAAGPLLRPLSGQTLVSGQKRKAEQGPDLVPHIRPLVPVAELGAGHRRSADPGCRTAAGALCVLHPDRGPGQTGPLSRGGGPGSALDRGRPSL